MQIADMSVELLDSMGSDLTVCQSARVSFSKSTEWERGPSGTINAGTVKLKGSDARLIKYLATHNHWSPFAHCFASFRIKAPVFVARQMVKHQVGLAWNEVSRRYVDEEPEFWFPETYRGRPTGSMKQGSSGVVTEMLSDNAIPVDPSSVFEEVAAHALNAYDWALRSNIAPEQARMLLPLNTMTEWIWSGSLVAFARVCNLRLDAHAQEETREVAVQINDEMKRKFPVSWAALTNKGD